jgi:hypothetical protein
VIERIQTARLGQVGKARLHIFGFVHPVFRRRGLTTVDDFLLAVGWKRGWLGMAAPMGTTGDERTYGDAL